MRCSIISLGHLAFAVAATAAPTVHIRNGTVIGSTLGRVDSFLGIPYALPPTGTRRLRKPEPITSSFGTLTAIAPASACPQPAVLALTPQSEDCLVLDIQRPANVDANSKLPVLFWIHGGGYQAGSARDFNGSPIVDQSIALGSPVIYVKVQYRLSAFGFLAGRELQEDGSTNLGLRDQRHAMQWVQENIEAFGGDPTKVTIWGQSAGSLSVFNHMLINGGDNSYKGGELFRAAIMSSGMAFPATAGNTAKPQARYDIMVRLTGCSGSSNTLSCLRNVSYDTFHEASNQVPPAFGFGGIDLPYLPRPDGSDDFFSNDLYQALAKGAFAKVPIISSSCEDEGTVFSLAQSNLTDTDDLITYFGSWFPTASRSAVADLVNAHPAGLPAGSPFRTGDLNAVYPTYKRVAAIITDFGFVMARRAALALMTSRLPAVYSSLASIAYNPINSLGTIHGADTLNLYLPAPTFNGNSTTTFYISFVNFLDPNLLGTQPNSVTWPKYNPAKPELLWFNAANNSVLPDTFRGAEYQAQSKHLLELSF